MWQFILQLNWCMTLWWRHIIVTLMLYFNLFKMHLSKCTNVWISTPSFEKGKEWVIMIWITPQSRDWSNVWRHQQQIFTFKVSNTLVTMATGYDWFFNKIQRNFPNYKQSYSLHCWIWRSNGKICTFEVSILIVKVYVAPSNKGKQLYQRCFAIIWNGVHLGNKILWNFPKKWSINPTNIHNL